MMISERSCQNERHEGWYRHDTKEQVANNIPSDCCSCYVLWLVGLNPYLQGNERGLQRTLVVTPALPLPWRRNVIQSYIKTADL